MRSFFFLLLAVLPSLALAGEASPVLDMLSRDRALIDKITGSQETLNRVKLLHLGRESMPARLELVKSAKRHLFVSIPYWYSDVTGKITYEAFAAKLRADPGLDVRILMDWTSPGSTGDILGIGMVRKLWKITDGNTILWNSPGWLRRFSKKLIANRMHDKLMIADGERLIMGGLNVGDSYLEGGITRKGWHDTDVLIEGPAAAEAARIFVKVWELAEYWKSLKSFPPFRAEGWDFLRNYYYGGLERLAYVKRVLGFRSHKEVHIPHLAQIRQLGVHASQARAVEGGVPVRLIYDNPLFNRMVNGRQPYCSFHCMLGRLLGASQRSVRIFLPYLSITEEFRSLLMRTARRGVKVEIITNSMQSHDIGGPAYFASMQHYLPLLRAGVVIHEWQGHADLLALEERHGCTIPKGHWPGRTMHSKALIIDGDLGIVGSHNMNVRSEYYNTEVMALVADRAFAQQLNDVFEFDLDRNGPRTVLCGNRHIARKRRVKTPTIPEVRHFMNEHKTRIRIFKRMQKLI